MTNHKNPAADQYLLNGCMRCAYGGTPQCKVNNWRLELELLRDIVLESGLKEEIKWGVPVYTLNGKNVVAVSALKGSAVLGFFKGVLLRDEAKILYQQGSKQSDRIIKFTDANQILKIKDLLTAYIHEAIEVEQSGKKVVFKQNPEPAPDELLAAFEEDPGFKRAFYALTPGRQRAYIIHFAQAKQSQTRINRIEKYKEQIFNGVGLNDKYSR